MALPQDLVSRIRNVKWKVARPFLYFSVNTFAFTDSLDPPPDPSVSMTYPGQGSPVIFIPSSTGEAFRSDPNGLTPFPESGASFPAVAARDYNWWMWELSRDPDVGSYTAAGLINPMRAAPGNNPGDSETIQFTFTCTLTAATPFLGGYISMSVEAALFRKNEDWYVRQSDIANDGRFQTFSLSGGGSSTVTIVTTWNRRTGAWTVAVT